MINGMICCMETSFLTEAPAWVTVTTTVLVLSIGQSVVTVY